MPKTLVAYFSATGTTKRAAEKIAEAANADLYEIQPAKPYTAADLNWHNEQSRSSLEMNNESCRPEIAENDVSIASYDAIFVGFPVWWYIEPRIIDTFLEAHDFTGKNVIPFATSGGSGLGEAPQRMRMAAKGATVLNGKVLSADISQKEIQRWLDQVK